MKKVWKKLRTSIILMKRSPSTWKLNFWRCFVEKFRKNLDFRFLWWKVAPQTHGKWIFGEILSKFWKKNRIFDYLGVKEPPTHENWFQRHFVKTSEKKSGAFIILNHLFPPEIAKIHLFGILTQNIKKILDDLGYPPESKSEKQENFNNFVLKSSCLWFSGS